MADFPHVLDRTQVESWQPSNLGYLTWAYDPITVSTSTTATGGTLYVVRLHLPVAATITNIVLHVATGGSSLTPGQNFAALYSAAGSLLQVSTDQTTPWGTSGVKVCALAAPYVAVAADYYVAYWSVGSTPAAFGRCAMTTGGAPNNAGLAAPNLRVATADTGLTTTAPATMGSQTSSGAPGWAALS